VDDACRPAHERPSIPRQDRLLAANFGRAGFPHPYATAHKGPGGEADESVGNFKRMPGGCTTCTATSAEMVQRPLWGRLVRAAVPGVTRTSRETAEAGTSWWVLLEAAFDCRAAARNLLDFDVTPEANRLPNRAGRA